MSQFTPEDLELIKAKGLSTEKVNHQLEHFKTGFPFMNIQAAATTQNGIVKLSKTNLEKYIKWFEENKANKKLIKFVPASGAASRMFKQLFEFEATYTAHPKQYVEFTQDKGLQSLYTFFKRLDDFAFFDQLRHTFKQAGENLEETLLKKDFKRILQLILFEEGLHYGSLPKGLLKFHRYPDGTTRTPVEEHLVEAAQYATDHSGKALLHFTISPEHLNHFKTLVQHVKTHYENQFGVSFDIEFSEQKPYTDQIAADMQNNPFRNPDGSLLFRPGGHGALIENLNELDADIIFVKNIDNVVPDRLKKDTIDYKKALAGILMETQNQIFNWIQKLDNNPNAQTVAEAEKFVLNNLYLIPAEEYADFDLLQKTNYLLSKLNRPTRVCGMVKNEGEPGGGPFWAVNPDKSVSLQIVESSQINPNSDNAKNILAAATHFNPVDLVCATKKHDNTPFDLLKHVDTQTGFITEKSKDGKNLKAQELPGLWNGAMSDWNTIFVEVPISTFNPVKTINDLLREQHQL